MVLLTLDAAHRAQAIAAGWRADGTGRYPEANPPLRWSANENVLWKTPMPNWSNASPVLAGDRVFVCSEPTTLLCVAAADGKVLWEKTNTYRDLPVEEKSAPPGVHGTNGYSSATPVSDGQRVYAVFATGVVACYDLEGNRRWIRLLEKPSIGHGHSASPLLAGGKLLVHFNSLWALDPETGETQWRCASQAAFGTPVPAQVDGHPLAITASGDVISVEDGKVLARSGIALTYNAPIVQDGIAYFIQFRGKAVRLPAALGGAATLESLWQTRPRDDRYYASPLYHDGLIYAITQHNFLSVIDSATGEVLCENRMELGDGTVYPSVTLAGGHLYVSSDNGSTLVLEPGRECKEIARNRLEVFRSTPVFRGKHLFIRGYQHLYCIQP
ncbi:MAG: PQQ-like beta-propeller repeat protein [Planctomycetes bacterium]|nr:PQQ-like beta-propeller repeat protein [Planctomycetota bacterium]